MTLKIAKKLVARQAGRVSENSMRNILKKNSDYKKKRICLWFIQVG
jgi:hypothetical protein